MDLETLGAGMGCEMQVCCVVSVLSRLSRSSLPPLFCVVSSRLPSSLPFTVTLTGDVKLAEGCSNDSERLSAKLGKTRRKWAKKAPVVVHEESDGFAGRVENVVAPEGSVQELTGLGRSTQSTESHPELSVGDSATSSTPIAHQDGVGNRGKRPVNPEDCRISNPSSSSFQNVGESTAVEKRRTSEPPDALLLC